MADEKAPRKFSKPAPPVKREALRPLRAGPGRIPLEVELSYSAGTAAAAAAAGWFFYEYATQAGFETFWMLLLCVFVVTAIEAFCLGLILHLLYRGIWLAAALASARSSPDLRALEETAAATFHLSFRYLGRAILLSGFFLAGAMRDQPDPWIGAIGGGAQLAYVGGLLTGALFRWWPELRLIRARAMRRFGLWWVDPTPRLARSWRYTAAVWIATPGLYIWNLATAFSPELIADREVYSRADGDRIALHFHQRGLRDGEAVPSWEIESTVPLEIDFHALDQARYVAILDAPELPVGVHTVRARLKVHGGEGARSSMQADWVEASFLVIE